MKLKLINGGACLVKKQAYYKRTECFERGTSAYLKQILSFERIPRARFSGLLTALRETCIFSEP
jgi:hypothetical protein